MSFLNNLRNREYRTGQKFHQDFLIPKIYSGADDSYVFNDSQSDESDNIVYGECLVGRFCPVPDKYDLLALTDENGYLYIQDTSRKGPESVVSSIVAHKSAIFDMTWMKNHSGALNIVTGSGDNTVALWDVETQKLQCVIECHEQSIRSVATHFEHPGLLASGGRDGKICIYDHRYERKEPINTIIGAHTLWDDRKDILTKGSFSSSISVAGILFQDEHTLISGGVTDGSIKVWDLRRTYHPKLLRQPQPLHTVSVGAIVTNLVLSPNNNKLYVSIKNNSILCFDAINYKSLPLCKFVGHYTTSKLSAYLISGLSSCGEYLSCGSSDDNNVYLWATRQSQEIYPTEEEKIREIQPIATLVNGHSDVVHCTQWSCRPNDLKLTSLSDDNSHRIWTVKVNQDKISDEYIGQNSRIGYTEIKNNEFFTAKCKSIKRNIPITPEKNQHKAGLLNLPNYVFQPDSLKHKCSPHVRKVKTNWLTALSPQNNQKSATKNKERSSGKVTKNYKKPDVKRKAAKKLSTHFKTIMKENPNRNQSKLNFLTNE